MIVSLGYHSVTYVEYVEHIFLPFTHPHAFLRRVTYRPRGLRSSILKKDVQVGLLVSFFPNSNVPR